MYAEFYGLSAEAFLLTPDHRFFFESSVHAQAMSFLKYGISRGEGFIVITGDIGAGKTTLVGRLSASIDTNRIISAHVVTTLLNGTDLLRLVASAFGLSNLPYDKASLLMRLQEFFQQAYRNRKRVLLLVDEAQNLSIEALEELRMLSNFQVGASAPFQSFLIGQPQFRTLLAHADLEQLRQRIIASYHLGAVSREECGEYLEHRLRCVGWEGDPYFEPEAIDAIYDKTDGIPRKINNLCSRLMLFGFLEELHRFTTADVERVASDLDTERTITKAPEPITAAAVVPVTPQPSNGHVPANGLGHGDVPAQSTARPPVDYGGSDVSGQLAALDRRIGVQEDFMRRLAVALQHAYTNR
ncbi:MAG TPA: XrtA/PEP-CTERM system-associated ATPase [Rhizomicrobium sp.]|jgi:general secretion pathway protein A|nr:XrtA/PEP-CTERM system-associated ATPase [Rhizomicrobium sp.]